MSDRRALSREDDREVDGASERLRLDLWLWRVRLFKTRTSAASSIEASGARIERDGQVRRIDKPSTSIACGDTVSFAGPDGRLKVIRILAIPQRRGPAPEAAACYEAAMSASTPPTRAIP